MARELGRLPATDDKHLNLFPLTATTAPEEPSPVVLGLDWYTNFDYPVWDPTSRVWRIGTGDLGVLRGGHCVCALPGNTVDYATWWRKMNQGEEGACCGFGVTRWAMLENRIGTFEPFWLYHEAQKIDEWPGEDYSGTSVRATFEVLRTRGHRIMRKIPGRSAWSISLEDPKWGISAYRWMTTVDAVLDVLKHPRAAKLNAIPLLNSWGVEGHKGPDNIWRGSGYPHVVWLDLDRFDALLRAGGDAATATDR